MSGLKTKELFAYRKGVADRACTCKSLGTCRACPSTHPWQLGKLIWPQLANLRVQLPDPLRISYPNRPMEDDLWR